LYKVGDKVVYPHHGAGTVVKREKREVLGEKREYLTIKILHNDMTVNVPAENAERVGLRKVIDEEAVKKVVKYLTSGGTEMPKNWNRRFKHNRDKMKTGDIYELAEVVRNLALRDGEKGLSTGEKQMYVKAKKILASELMYAKTMSEDEALEWLEETLTNGAKPKATPAERKAAATAARPAATVKKAAPVAKKAAPAKAKSVASRTVVKSSGVKSSVAKSAAPKSAKPAAAAKRKTTAAK
jgi:CarD family transcriptional regulator